MTTDPSQRNVATLYEYWTFLKLAVVVGNACQDSRVALELFRDEGDGLSLGLKRGQQSALPWEVVVAGRRLGVTLFFNRTFRVTDSDLDGSWSRPMVPDASVLIRPVDGRTRVENERDLDVWLHFDAKYKLDWNSAQFDPIRGESEEETALEDEERERVGVSRRDDLLKMHAYRDAIRRSAGAYVLFPGASTPRSFRQYVELIPGLGAFPLRPGDDSGLIALRRFVGDVLLHAADQATAEERNRFWQARVFSGTSHSEGRTADFLARPPADTQVLICWVPDDEHWLWTETTEQYVVRLPVTDGGIAFRAEELAAPLVVLVGVQRAVVYERRSAWAIVNADELHVLGHPDTSSESALLCRLIPIQAQPPWLDELPLADFLARTPSPGAPLLVDWSRLIQTEARALGWREESTTPYRADRTRCSPAEHRSGVTGVGLTGCTGASSTAVTVNAPARTVTVTSRAAATTTKRAASPKRRTVVRCDSNISVQGGSCCAIRTAARVAAPLDSEHARTEFHRRRRCPAGSATRQIRSSHDQGRDSSCPERPGRAPEFAGRHTTRCMGFQPRVHGALHLPRRIPSPRAICLLAQNGPFRAGPGGWADSKIGVGYIGAITKLDEHGHDRVWTRTGSFHTAPISSYRSGSPISPRQ